MMADLLPLVFSVVILDIQIWEAGLAGGAVHSRFASQGSVGYLRRVFTGSRGVNPC